MKMFGLRVLGLLAFALLLPLSGPQANAGPICNFFAKRAEARQERKAAKVTVTTVTKTAPVAVDYGCHNDACDCTHVKNPNGRAFYACPGQAGLPGCECSPTPAVKPSGAPKQMPACPGGVCPIPQKATVPKVI